MSDYLFIESEVKTNVELKPSVDLVLECTCPECKTTHQIPFENILNGFALCKCGFNFSPTF